jgi:hypothetical protein
VAEAEACGETQLLKTCYFGDVLYVLGLDVSVKLFETCGCCILEQPG